MTETTAATDRGHADAIAAIFEDLLGIAPVGTDEDFFALGGHSLLAVQLMARINETFETDVPLAALFDVDGADGDVTPTRVARLVSGGFGGLDQPDLVRLATGPGPQMYCFPPAGGDVIGLREFAAEIALAGAVTAFQYPSAEQGEDLSVEALAARFVAAVSDGPPAGAVLLGWSMGGLVALEAARQLAAAGRPPARLVLVDSYPARTNPEADGFGIIDGLVEELSSAIGRSLAVDLDAARTLPIAQAAELVLAAAADMTAKEQDIARTKVRTLVAHVTAAGRYCPEVFAGPVTLIQAAEVSAEMRDLAGEAWKGVCPQLTRVTIPGGHLSLLSPPYVEKLVLTVLDSC